MIKLVVWRQKNFTFFFQYTKSTSYYWHDLFTLQVHRYFWNWVYFKAWAPTFVHKQWREFEARHCPTTPNV